MMAFLMKDAIKGKEQLDIWLPHPKDFTAVIIRRRCPGAVAPVL